MSSEAAFAVVLLVASLLLGRSFVRLMHVDAGYSAADVLIANVIRPGSDQASAERFGSLMSAALERIKALPGVETAGIGSPTPLDENTSLSAFPVPGSTSNRGPLSGAGQAPQTALARFYTISPGFERALGLRLRGGRFFSRDDQVSDDARWIVNEEFARLYLPANPVGRRFPWSRRGRGIQLEIVGVVGNVLKNGNAEAPVAEVYGVRSDTDPFYNYAIVIRTSANPGGQAAAIRSVLKEAAPDALVNLVPLSTRVSESLARPRLASAVFAAIAALATLLTALGIFAVLSYELAQRRQEFGVRMAIGAVRHQLVALALRDGMVPTIAGVAAGLVVALLMTRLMRGVLFGISPLDAIAFLAAPVVLVPVSVAGCIVPALRAARVDPASVLKVG